MKNNYQWLAISLLTLTLASCSMKNETHYGFIDQSNDVGDVKHPGKTEYNPENEKYTLTGSGTNMWFDNDEFHFAWKKVTGDVLLYTLVDFVGTGVDAHRKAGLIIRKNLNPGSPYVSAAYHGDGLVSMQYRMEENGETAEIRHTDTLTNTLQLGYSNGKVTMHACEMDDPLQETGEISFSILDEYYVGLFVCSHNPDVSETAIFSNTRFVVPVPDNFVAYRDFAGSRIEVLDVETGARKLIYETDDNLEAPNWTPDGHSLILNGRGKLYKLTIDKDSIEPVNTGFATSLNNDHGISPDGTQLVISHHVDDLPAGQNSLIFTLPLEGGEPQKVTENGPSYWHGWSPDGKYLLYTANRNDQWDIYRIPAEGGEEVQLTNSPGLDDGSEYSTDGQHIWFNSVRSGSMEIWRMNADGTDPLQITNDEYQNWFPHESPDGSKIIFLSYLPDVNPGDHPYYKQVMLRIMDKNDLKPRVIVHLYGGQGTINVPSWSPDSKKVAFVSNHYQKSEP